MYILYVCTHTYTCTKACLVVKNEDSIILGINSSKLNSALTKYIFKYICIHMHICIMGALSTNFNALLFHSVCILYICLHAQNCVLI